MKTAVQTELSAQERIIKRGMSTFIAVGTALAVIREKRLYKAKYATFDDYCSERWGWDRRYASKVIGAAHVVEILSPIGDSLPANEAQARPLVDLSREDANVVWQGVVTEAKATGLPITAEQVQRAADLRNPLKQKPAKRMPDKVGVFNAVSLAIDNILGRMDGWEDEEIAQSLTYEERRTYERAVAKATEFVDRGARILNALFPTPDDEWLPPVMDADSA